MELYLNELSINPLAQDKYIARENMSVFVKCVATAKKNGFRNLKSDLYKYQVDLSEGYSLKDWLNDKEVSLELRSILFGFMIPPFIDEADEQVMNQFIDAKYCYLESNHAEVNCIGLAAAYLYESLTISFTTNTKWMRHNLPLHIKTTTTHEIVEVVNVFDDVSFEEPNTALYVTNMGELNLKPTAIPPENKVVTLFGDHHGKSELERLSNKLRKCEYVIEMKSTNFGGSRFIRRIQPNGEVGVIEVVLMRSDARYGLWIKTTGANYRETKAIADILNEKYS